MPTTPFPASSGLDSYRKPNPGELLVLPHPFRLTPASFLTEISPSTMAAAPRDDIATIEFFLGSLTQKPGAYLRDPVFFLLSKIVKL
jgi:hypothetical protein